MANFSGYLLRVPGGSIFPHKYMLKGSYSSDPNQREEIKAFRDDNTRDLHRVTADGMKTKFSFKIKKGLRLSEKKEIQAFFQEAYGADGQKERKCHLTYWDDEENAYKTGYFYIPNFSFPISYITDSDIIYDEIDLQFVEY